MYRRHAVVVVCGLLAVGTSLTASGAGTDLATLKRIASRLDNRAAVIAIEASAPVAYVAAQPDPRTFVIELRDVVSQGFADNFTPDPRHPFEAVSVETLKAADGVSVARVQMTLAHAVRPRVRSSRNIIYVEADRLDRTARTAGTIASAGPASAILHLNAARRGSATAVTLYGSGRLSAARVEAPIDGAPRLVIDLPNATSAMARTTTVGEGPVDKVHIALDQNSPPVTRVVMDLTRRAPYRIEPSADGTELTVLFDDPAGPPAVEARQSAGPAPPAEVLLAQAQTAPAPQAPAAPAPAPQVVQPQAPAPPAAQVPTLPGAVPQRFTGFPISLDFQGADLRAVLRTFSEISGLNVVIDPSIQGTVDVALRDVPWDQALDIILRANQLGYSVEGTVVRIAPLRVLAAEQAERQKLAEAQALAGELETLTRTLSYARAEQVQPLITATVLSQRGSITTDPRTNTLIIRDLPERLAAIGGLLGTLDRPEPQVEIEARIVQTTRDFARQLGVQWGFNGRATTTTGNPLPVAFPNQAEIGGRTGGTQGPDAAATGVNLPANLEPATSAIGLALGSINGALNLDVALSALESNGNGRILSTPRVTTQNNIEAQIQQGIQIPIQTVANNTVTVTFRDATLRLSVVPQITAAGTVIMRIVVANEVPDFTRQVNGIPPINTQNATTQVLVSDGETTVIGGIYVSAEQQQQDRTPGLYRLPLLGWLFQRNTILDESRELLIFITPRIIRL
jgi:type IV pilus assembly protein PilQ